MLLPTAVFAFGLATLRLTFPLTRLYQCEEFLSQIRVQSFPSNLIVDFYRNPLTACVLSLLSPRRRFGCGRDQLENPIGAVAGVCWHVLV